ncbi:MAG: ABC transporter permease subunit [Verrucomicrobia bacterium]|nr:MAG: ABC transporter permease subunit [Verrucomicrobiota bacterium]
MSRSLSSSSRILAIAGNTFTDQVRQKVFLFLLIFSLMVIGCSSFLARFSFQEEFQMLKDVALGAMSLFLSFLAILAAAMLLPRDLEDRTIFTILSKPVPRHEYLLGKLLGVLAMLLLSTLVMGVLFLTVLLLREQSVILETRTTLAGSPQELVSALAEVRKSAFNWNLIPAMGILFAKASLIASLTLMISTFATSGIFAILMSATAYFIGHLQETAREYWLGGVDVHWWSRFFSALLALVFPDLQAFNLSDDIVVGKGLPMDVFWQTMALGGVYTVIYYLVACFLFQKREL